MNLHKCFPFARSFPLVIISLLIRWIGALNSLANNITEYMHGGLLWRQFELSSQRTHTHTQYGCVCVSQMNDTWIQLYCETYEYNAHLYDEWYGMAWRGKAWHDHDDDDCEFKCKTIFEILNWPKNRWTAFHFFFHKPPPRCTPSLYRFTVNVRQFIVSLQKYFRFPLSNIY